MQIIKKNKTATTHLKYLSWWIRFLRITMLICWSYTSRIAQHLKPFLHKVAHMQQGLNVCTHRMVKNGLKQLFSTTVSQYTGVPQVWGRSVITEWCKSLISSVVCLGRVCYWPTFFSMSRKAKMGSRKGWLHSHYFPWSASLLKENPFPGLGCFALSHITWIIRTSS